ncbi:MAG: SDR family oxidoreductase [Planctomycetota bacterium]
MSDFLQLAGKTILVTGVANKKSVAYHTHKVLVEAGARVIHMVRSQTRKESVAKILPDSDIYICDVEFQDQIDQLAQNLKQKNEKIHGLLHSMAFANYEEGWKPFHETKRDHFLQAVNISCFSLIALSQALKEILDPQASVVTVGISNTKMAAENYGYMGPIKAALESSVVFLAKSFSLFSQIRFNSVNPGLLKTSASAGIPGYLDHYLFAEKATLRKKAVQTEEVANTIAFLLSPRSSGINAQGIVLDAGMGVNYFDTEIVKANRSS